MYLNSLFILILWSIKYLFIYRYTIITIILIRCKRRKSRKSCTTERFPSSYLHQTSIRFIITYPIIFWTYWQIISKCYFKSIVMKNWITNWKMTSRSAGDFTTFRSWCNWHRNLKKICLKISIVKSYEHTTTTKHMYVCSTNTSLFLFKIYNLFSIVFIMYL